MRVADIVLYLLYEKLLVDTVPVAKLPLKCVSHPLTAFSSPVASDLRLSVPSIPKY